MLIFKDSFWGKISTATQLLGQGTYGVNMNLIHAPTSLQELRRGDRAATVPDTDPERDWRPPLGPRVRHGRRRREAEQVVDLLREPEEEVPQERAQEVEWEASGG